MTTTVQFVNSYAIGYNQRSADNKAQFTQVLDLLKTKATREATTKELLVLAKGIKLDSARRELQALVRSVVAYLDMGTQVVNFNNITYDNLKRVVRVSKYLTKHYEGDMAKLEPLKVWNSGMSQWRYNNDLEVAVRALSDSIKVEPKQEMVTVESALVYLDTVKSTEVKTAMLERLMSELGYSMKEVA